MTDSQPLHRQTWVRILALVGIALLLNVGSNVFNNGSAMSNITGFWLVIPIVALVVVELVRTVRGRRGVTR
jgi:phosphate/sulfate permease